jgi:hypothetical protein
MPKSRRPVQSSFAEKSWGRGDCVQHPLMQYLEAADENEWLFLMNGKIDNQR